jgi:hypothetical protein
MALGFVGGPSGAQEGHPLVGSWHGDFGLQNGKRMNLTVIMDWDGKQVTGLVNPATDHARLRDARLNSGDWTVHFAVQVGGEGGTVLDCVADGKLDHLGSDQRTLAGPWVCGGQKGDFKLVRDRDY